MADWIDVAPADALQPGSFRVVDIKDAMVAVFNVDGTFHAIEDMCTHDGGILSGGRVSDTCITCPRHGARFSLVTGEALSPPAYEPIHVFPVRIEQGMLQVRDNRWD